MSSKQLSSKKSAELTTKTTENPAKALAATSTTQRVGKYTIIGITLTVFNFVIYTVLARIFSNNDFLWFDSIISYIAATFLAYFLHSRITWQERPVTKHGIAMFFAWNFLTALIISPLLTWLFGFITPVYEFAFDISSAIHLPFDYEFIESTGIFCFAGFITMILNYFFYDRLVFGQKKGSHHEKSPK